MAPIPTTTAEDDSQWSAAEFLRGVYLAFSLLGLFSNGLVLFVFIRVRSLRTITNLFIGNQSLIDMVSCIFLLLNKYREFNVVFPEVSRAYGLVACLFWSSDYIYWALVISSTANLVILTLERYIAVFRPNIYRQRVNWKTASVAAVSVWAFGFIWLSYWPAIHRLQGGKCFPDWRFPSLRIVFGLAQYTLTLIMPTILMIWVYMSILRKFNTMVGNGATVNVNPTTTTRTTESSEISRISGSLQNNKRAPDRSRERAHGGPPKQTPAASDAQRKIRMNVIKTLFIAALVFAICWAPNQTMFLLYALGYDIDLSGLLKTTAVCLQFSNMWINPFIYAFKYRKFQHGLRIVFLGKPRILPQ